MEKRGEKFSEKQTRQTVLAVLILPMNRTRMSVPRNLGIHLTTSLPSSGVKLAQVYAAKSIPPGGFDGSVLSTLVKWRKKKFRWKRKDSREENGLSRVEVTRRQTVFEFEFRRVKSWGIIKGISLSFTVSSCRIKSLQMALKCLRACGSGWRLLFIEY